VSISVTDFLTLALTEIRAVRAGDVPSAEDLALALQVFNELLDAWNAEDQALYTLGFATFTLTPNLQPHTIGLSTNTPTPTFSVSVTRPQKVRHANIVLSTNIRAGLNIVDDDGWNAILAGAAAGQTPTVFSAVPTDLYYSPDWPNGSLYLWPVPNTAYGLELETDTLLASVASTDTFTLPPGYQQALRLTLAELLAAAFGQQVLPTTTIKAREARARLFGANAYVPNLMTRDGGLPGGRPPGSNFDYRSGTFRT
jgi:hypothetical protein